MTTPENSLDTGYSYRLKSLDTGHGRIPCYEMIVELPKNMPNFFVDCLLNDLEPQRLLHSFSDSQRLTLEGSFSDFYDTYTSDVTRLDFLVVMAPNIMYSLMKMGVVCDIEFVDNRMTLFWPVPENYHDPSQEIITTATVLTKELDRILKRYDQIYIGKPVDETIDSARDAGTRLQRASGFTRPRTPVQVADMVVYGLVWLLIVGLGFVFITNSPTDPSVDSLENALMAFVASLIFDAVIFLIFILPVYFGLVRRRIRRNYKKRLQIDYETARQNLAIN